MLTVTFTVQNGPHAALLFAVVTAFLVQQLLPRCTEKRFGNLFSGSLADRSNHATANMTIVERAAAAQKAKLQQVRTHHTVSTPLPSAWDGLDTLAQSSTTGPPPSRSAQDDFDFSAFASSTTSTSKAPLGGDDWGLSDFVAPQPQSFSQQNLYGT